MWVENQISFGILHVKTERWAFLRYILMLQFSVASYSHSMDAHQNGIVSHVSVCRSFEMQCWNKVHGGSWFIHMFNIFIICRFPFSILYSNFEYSSSVRKFIFYFICSRIENSFRLQSDVPSNRLNHPPKCIWMNKREKRAKTLNVKFNIWFEFIEIHRTCFDTGL